MSEHTEAVEKRLPPKHKPKQQRSGSSGAFLAMVIALAAGGGSYYVWQQYLIAEQGQRALEQGIEQLLRVVEEKDRAQLVRIEQLAAHGHHNVEQRLTALEQTLPHLSQQLSVQQLDWSLAEVDYLLRLAEHRLQLSHDIPTAIAALSQARDQLTIHTGDQFADVINNIGASINHLSTIEQDNLELITARLSGLLATLDTLPYAAQAERTDTPQPPQTPLAADAKLADHIKHWGDIVWQDLKSLVTIRRSDEVRRPLMNPEQRYFLQAQLRLKLETARLATMGRNQPLYHASLEEAASWLDRYYDKGDSRVAEGMAGLHELLKLTVDPELPSLQGLRQQLHAERLSPSIKRSPVTEQEPPVSLPDTPVEEPGAESPR
jgi:uroporphyrin-3 C-methyltransferase